MCQRRCHDLAGCFYSSFLARHGKSQAERQLLKKGPMDGIHTTKTTGGIPFPGRVREKLITEKYQHLSTRKSILSHTRQIELPKTKLSINCSETDTDGMEAAMTAPAKGALRLLASCI